MRPSWFRVGPISDDKCPIRDRKECIETWKEGHVKAEAELGVASQRPRIAWSHQELNKARKVLSWCLQRVLPCGTP
jgi:hypothetical protein